jgi:hypothetical protein
MKRILSDEEIERLIRERKQLPQGWESRFQVRPKSDYRYTQRNCEIKSEEGNFFNIIIRQSTVNLLDFSIILMFKDKDGVEYRLCRYNGKHPSGHTNRFEKNKGLQNDCFRNVFHIHKATQRYQEEGFDITGYAEPTKDYSSFDSALKVFLQKNGFVEDLPLFDNEGIKK